MALALPENVVDGMLETLFDRGDAQRRMPADAGEQFGRLLRVKQRLRGP